MADLTLNELARQFLADCRARNWRVATAESCTGGLIAAALTEIAGSSDVVDRGFVTYSNRAKSELLGLDLSRLDGPPGAVSKETAIAMAIGARERSGADLTLSVTGIAGPGGATETKPVGLVHFGVAGPDGLLIHHHEVFVGDRGQIRAAAVLKALTLGWRAMGA